MGDLAWLERERDERVRRVLAQADQRQARREQALRRVAQESPEAPLGLVADLQLIAHQQALLAWEAAKEVAAKLLEQAKRLAARLLQATWPEHLAAWAKYSHQPEQPRPSAVEPALAVTAKPLQPTPPQARELKLPNLIRSSMQDQYRLYNHIVDQLKAYRQWKVQRVAGKLAKRLERRENSARSSEANSPRKPRGLPAAFKKSEYDQAVKAYWQRQRRDRLLVEQAAKLHKGVLDATHRSENWAVRKLQDLQPEFVERVERYVRGNNQRMQIAELEARKLQSVRGIEGPKRRR